MHILLAEDDACLADGLSEQLRDAGFSVEHAANGAVAEYLLESRRFDLAILDIGLPMLDGLSVLRRVRAGQPTLPMVLLTARDGLEDRVTGLQFGADDYVTKPFDFPELEARLRALLRRTQAHAGSAMTLGELVFDPKNRSARIGAESVDLSGREATLLALLLRHRDSVVGKDQITQAWAEEGGETGAGNSIEVYIHRLRRKLEHAKVTIRTVRGLGYLMTQEVPGGTR